MKHSTWFRIAFPLLAAAGALVMPRPVLANPIVPFTLAYEQEGLDLDTGTIVPIKLWTVAVNPADPQPDLVLGYNSERAVCAVVFHNRTNGVQIAFLDGVAFNRADSADLAGLRFTTAIVDKPFETGDSVVLRTDTGAHYLMGNPIEVATGVTFDTQLLDETTLGVLHPAEDEPRLMSRIAPQGKASQLTSASLPGGLSVEDWRQIRGLIEVDSAGAVNSVTIGPTVRHEDAKLTASDGAEEDWFGLSVAVSGDTALVGAYRHDPGRAWDAGAAYVFVRNGTRWSEQAKLTASDAAISQAFGISVALSGDTAVVGAQWDYHLGVPSHGAAYVFVRSGTTWSEQAKLTASDAAARDLLGASVALSGDTAIVGAVLDDHGGVPEAGSAYVFVRNGTTWSEQAKLTASDAASPDYFSYSVALSGDTALVGAHLDDHEDDTNDGSAYVFVRNGTTWSEQAKLTVSDNPGHGHRFGYSVALSGNTAVVGAIYAHTTGAPVAGSAYVFVRSETTWSEQAKLTASDAASGDSFGYSVALSGDTAVVGADDNNVHAGAAYLFLRGGTSWSEQVKLTASDAAVADFLGTSVALSGNTAVVGAYGDDDNDSRSGSAYVFTVCGYVDTTAPELSVTLTPDTLWPPNHDMVEVTATVTATDDCTRPAIEMISLTSNEADDAPGGDDGRTTGDVQPGADDFHFSLRAERASTGGGRIYTAVYTATDGSGNVATEVACVVVPHDQRGRARVQLCNP